MSENTTPTADQELTLDHEDEAIRDGVGFVLLPPGATGQRDIDELYGLLPVEEKPAPPPPVDALVLSVQKSNPELVPEVLPACATCPLAQWRLWHKPASGSPKLVLDCYCGSLHRDIYSSLDSLGWVEACAARQAALDEQLQPAPGMDADHAPAPSNKP